MNLKEAENPLFAVDERKVTERRQYDHYYGSNEEFTSSRVRQLLLQESERAFERLVLSFASGARVLEIGCGTGELAVKIADFSPASVTGIDISEEGVKRASALAAKRNIGHLVHFELGDVENLRFSDGEFDLIVNHEVFSSLDLAKVVPELRRVLRPGGKVISLECLAHNPIFNLNRKMKARRGAHSEWAASHILTLDDLGNAGAVFDNVSFEPYHLFVILLGPLLVRLPDSIAKPLISTLELLDALILKLPFVRRLAFKVLTVWQ